MSSPIASTTSPVSVPLYQRLLGASFGRLPPEIRALRAVSHRRMAAGRCDIERGPHPVARFIADRLGLPPSGQDVVITACFTASGDREIWDRYFATTPMRTVHAVGQGRRRGLLVEEVGRLSFLFRVAADEAGLRRDLVGLRVCGITVPKPADLTIAGRETVQDGRFQFAVTMTLPGIGALIEYKGWLVPIEESATRHEAAVGGHELLA